MRVLCGGLQQADRLCGVVMVRVVVRRIRVQRSIRRLLTGVVNCVNFTLAMISLPMIVGVVVVPGGMGVMRMMLMVLAAMVSYVKVPM